MEDKSKEELRSSLDDLLGYDLPDEVDGLNEKHNLPKVRADKTQSQGMALAKSKAKKVMDSLLRFYLSEEIIEEQEYIKAKQQIDTAAIGMLIRQMENSEHAISILMSTIDEGDVAPRMFEVLSDLQRTLLDIIKSQTMYMMAVEENTKKIARDLDIYQSKGVTTNNKKGGVKSRGTKDLMKALQDSLQEDHIQDTNTIDDEIEDEE